VGIIFSPFQVLLKTQGKYQQRYKWGAYIQHFANSMGLGKDIGSGLHNQSAIPT
jgi:hypothetical protein